MCPNGTGAMTTAKNDVFIGLSLENCYLVGRRGGGGGREGGREEQLHNYTWVMLLIHQ